MFLPQLSSPRGASAALLCLDLFPGHLSGVHGASARCFPGSAHWTASCDASTLGFHSVTPWEILPFSPISFWNEEQCAGILCCMDSPHFLVSLPADGGIFFIYNPSMGTSLAVQWLRLHTSTAGGAGSIPGWGD